MPVFSTLLLLAACSLSVTAGPVPGNTKRQLLTSYANTSVVATSTMRTIQVSHSAADLSSLAILSQGQAVSSTLISKAYSSHARSPETSSSPGQSAQANTAIIVQPIQATVLTHVIPGATFVNPNGKPLLTDTPQTVVSTSFITPTLPPQTSKSPSATPQSSVSATSKVASSGSNEISPSSKSDLPVPSSSIVVIGNGTAGATSRHVPTFSYSPEEKTGVSFASSTAPAASSQPSLSSGALLGSIHANSTSRSGQITSLTATTSPSQTPDVAEPTSPVLVIVTEYTTVYATPATKEATFSSTQKSTLTSAINTVFIASPSVQQTVSTPAAISSNSAALQESAASPLSSAPPALPTTLLPLPPLVIITMYTTVTPTESTPSQVPGAPNLSASVSASTYATPSAIPPVASPSDVPIPSSNIPQDPPAPAPTNTPSAPVPAPSNSEGPLIITPIAPSQIFTVTVTTTEKETVRETTTVTVTARA